MECAVIGGTVMGSDASVRLLRRALQAVALLLVAGLLLLLLWRLAGADEGGSLVGDIRNGESPEAPLFDLPVIWDQRATWPTDRHPALADGRVALAELRGYPVVLNFWASWCTPCKAEAPILAASARSHAGSVLFLGIDVQDFESDARRFLRRYKANYVSVRDGGSSTYEAYGLTGLPETYHLDSRGRVVAHTVGQLSREELEDGVAASVGEAP